MYKHDCLEFEEAIVKKENMADNKRVTEYYIITLKRQSPADPNQVHCDIYAWNAALDNGLDPRGQNGEEWDGNRLTVNQIYDLYPNNRNNLPPANSRGFAFYDGVNSDNDNPTHMEFYDNTNENNGTYIRYGTDGITSPVQTERDINLPANGNWVYIPLNELN